MVPDALKLTGEPGSRAPHLWLDRAGARISTLDLYERSLVLLASPHSPWLAAAAEVAAGLPAPLDAYGVGEGADLVPEPGADWAEAHGITPDGAVLVRPDGFVAWRHEGAAGNPATTLRDAVATLLSRA